MGRSALHPIHLKDDDIVRPLEKSLDTCNQLVVGSNPTAGASDINPPLGGFCRSGSERRTCQWHVR